MMDSTETKRQESMAATHVLPPRRPARRDIRDILFLALLVSVPCLAIAAELDLSSSPLFLSINSKPNIVFLADDAGTMDYAILTTESTSAMTISACSKTYYYTHHHTGFSGNAPAKNNGDVERVIPTEVALNSAGYTTTALQGGVWRARNSDYNRLYYNPNVTYTYWGGVNVDSTAYTDASPTAAPYDPYYSGTGGDNHGTINLTSTQSFTAKYCTQSGGALQNGEAEVSVSMYPAHYYTWTDSNSDGVVDASDSHTLYEIRPASGSGSSSCTSGATCPTTFTRTSARTDCADYTACTRTEELQNFANWFSYYRKRNLVVKGAISNVVAPSSTAAYRMAHASLNNTGNSNVAIAQMNTSATSGNKKTLLDGVFKSEPGNNVSNKYLRTQLDAVGRYFECATGNIFGATGSSCPIQSAADGGSCQQNFAILLTDGYWNDSFSGVGNTDTDGSGSYDGGAYADSYSNTLADVAMHYYERDLAPNLSDSVPVVAGIDEATHQHMVTYAVAFGVSGTLSADPSDSAAAFSWPDPTAAGASSATKIDDLRHAAYNGRGEFLSGQTPSELITALETALTSIASRTGSAAAVAVNSRSLSTTTRLYQARFNSDGWSGELRALALTTSGDVSTEVWNAKDQLASQAWDTGREILARNTSTGTGVPFLWDNLSTAQQDSLHDDPSTISVVDNDSKGQNRLKWLRGDTSNEGTGDNFRTRANSFKLGDIVNSSPIFVGAPINLPDLETSPHSTFRSNYVNRREMVYVGANDGMLHGFDAATGQEKIAYVPSMVFSKLSELTYTNYSHKYYVDGSPTVGDAYGTFTNISSVCSTGCWRTVLIGGLAGGGKGVYALDITDPDGSVTTSGLSTALLEFDEDNASRIALWEYTADSDNDMGYVYGQPTIAKVRTSSNSYAWAAIFGNGYNSTNQNAVLYIVKIIDGTLIRKITLNPEYTGWGSTGNSNGLSAPAVVDTGGDYVADRVYAGDLRGNMWRVDLTDNNPNNWDSKYSGSGNPRPLFQAVDGSNNEQAITVRPEVGEHPDGEDGYMVYFGTGKYLENNDNSSSNISPVNTFYGIWDASYSGSGTPVTRAKLLPQTISTATVSSTTVRQVTNDTINNWDTAGSCNTTSSGNCLGWSDDLLTATTGSLGEKAVSNPVLLGGAVPRIIFTTLIPESTICSSGGTSWLMELNPTNGGRLPEQVFDVDGNGTIDENDMIGGTVPVAGINPGIGIMPEPTIIRDPANKTDLKAETGSTGAVVTLKNYVSGTTGGRQSWRQLK